MLRRWDAEALSLAGGASASISSARDKPTQYTAPVFLAEEEILDVSLATFYFFNKENAGAHRPGVHLPLPEGAETVQEAAAGAQCAEAAGLGLVVKQKYGTGRAGPSRRGHSFRFCAVLR